MGQLITELFAAFQETITGMTMGIKTAFETLIFVDPTATEQVLSPLGIFVFVMLGLSLALGVVSMIFTWVRNRS